MEHVEPTAKERAVSEANPERATGPATATGPAVEDTPAEKKREVRPAGLGVVGWARWFWRTLTSMRTALILLFLFALASIPGSLWPQRGISDAKVAQYF